MGARAATWQVAAARVLIKLVYYGLRDGHIEVTLRIVNADAQIGRTFSVCGLDAMLTGPAAP